MSASIIFKDLGCQDFQTVWQAQRAFTDSRHKNTDDEIWFVEHPAVFTHGQASKSAHILKASDIPIVQTDRGGQVTYHALGQLVAYTLVDLRRRKLGIRDFVCLLESIIIALLAEYNIQAERLTGAPGIYVQGKKIASLGLRVRHGCAYHGLALNIDMNLEPFTFINPCGLAGMQMTQLTELTDTAELQTIKNQLKHLLTSSLPPKA